MAPKRVSKTPYTSSRFYSFESVFDADQNRTNQMFNTHLLFESVFLVKQNKIKSNSIPFENVLPKKDRRLQVIKLQSK